jgi:hypothetical protein
MTEVRSIFISDSTWNFKKTKITFKLKIKVLRWNKLQSNQNIVQIWIPESHADYFEVFLTFWHVCFLLKMIPNERQHRIHTFSLSFVFFDRTVALLFSSSISSCKKKVEYPVNKKYHVSYFIKFRESSKRMLNSENINSLIFIYYSFVLFILYVVKQYLFF